MVGHGLLQTRRAVVRVVGILELGRKSFLDRESSLNAVLLAQQEKSQGGESEDRCR